MREPEQVQRLAPDPCRVPCLNRPLQRGGEYGSDQISDLLVEQPREFSVVEMAGDHQPEPLGFLLIGRRRDLLEMADHAADQHDQRFRRRLQPEQPVQRRIGLAFLREDFRIQRRLRRESA